ncbi:MAG TPA: hypothetical protein VF502_01465 [Stellaceae bacterium]
MRRLLSLATSILVLTMWVAAANAQTTSPYNTNSAPPPGTPVSPLPGPDASTQRGQGAVGQPLAPPSPSQYNETQTDTGKQSGTTVPGSPVSPLPAPDASTAPGQDRQNTDMAIGRHEGGGITEQK